MKHWRPNVWNYFLGLFIQTPAFQKIVIGVRTFLFYCIVFYYNMFWKCWILKGLVFNKLAVKLCFENFFLQRSPWLCDWPKVKKWIFSHNWHHLVFCAKHLAVWSADTQFMVEGGERDVHGKNVHIESGSVSFARIRSGDCLLYQFN